MTDDQQLSIELMLTKEEFQELHDLLSKGRDKAKDGSDEHSRFNHWMEVLEAHIHILDSGGPYE